MVAAFKATDPEGEGITWSLTGDDDGDLRINESGEIRFNSPPDYENPSGGTDGTSNTYRVTVTATDSGGNTDTFEVEVKVTNVDEDEEVSWAVDPDGAGTLDPDIVNGGMPIVQFQVGASLTVNVAGGDASDTASISTTGWRWYRSPSKDSQGTLIEDETAATYTVKDADVDMYIRVEVFYYVGNGLQESRSLTSDYPVLTSGAGVAAPELEDSITRKVNEGEDGMAVGDPVTATGGHGALNYVLTGTDNAKFKIDQKTGQITTMVDLDYEAGAGDADNCVVDDSCVVTITATDAAGRSNATAASVTITIENVDEKPYFDSTPATPAIDAPASTITHAELSGDPLMGTTALLVDGNAAPAYSALDPEGRRVNLTLTGADGALFWLNSDEVLSFRAAPDFEEPADANRDNVYEVTVRATERAMHEDRMVTITVTDVNEAPEIADLDSPIKYEENGEDVVATFAATDPEDDKVTWSLTGTDAGDLRINESGEIRFNSPPDYENPSGGTADDSNTYSVTVTATDSAGNTGTFAADVEVTNAEEAGKVTWTVQPGGSGTTYSGMKIRQFHPNAVLAATVTDPDGGVTGQVWQWYRSPSSTSRGTAIDGETANSYTVTIDDVDNYLRVEVGYTDGSGNQESAFLHSSYKVLPEQQSTNEPPVFGDTAEARIFARKVNEGAKGMKVGDPVTATDDSGGAVAYELVADAGADRVHFAIDQATGQITTTADLDFEAPVDKGGDDDDNIYIISVRATDGAGARTSNATDADVHITVENVDESPSFSSGYETASVPEGTEVVDTDGDTDSDPTTGESVYEATDPESHSVSLLLMGADMDLFSLSNAGNLSFNTAPDFENPMDKDRDNVYQLTVRATDGAMHEDRTVTITVTDADESPEIMENGLWISGDNSHSIDENTTAVGMYALSGPMVDMSSWDLSGVDARAFSINDGMLSFISAPNYERPTDADRDNTYMVTVEASDGENEDTRDVTVKVTNVREDGTVKLDPDRPTVDTEITASVTDPDGGVTGEVWQWARSENMDSTFTDITGATSASYTPVDSDQGYYLRAAVSYTDGYGGDNAAATTGKAVGYNSAPDFGDAPVTREVPENSKAGANVGDPVTATDADGDTLTYALSGDDAGFFDIDNMGQITVSSGTELDYEAEKNQYMVTVTATDSSGASNNSASIDVTINVTDVDERGPLVARYDANGDGAIDIGELFTAIDDYFTGGIGIGELFTLIDLYFSGPA